MKKIVILSSLLSIILGLGACSTTGQRIPAAEPVDPSIPSADNNPSTPTGPSAEELRITGEKIFKNETGGQIEKTVHWNVGEDFAAMGIAHFTWYPPGRAARYGNTFPGVLNYMTQRGSPPPAWIQFAAARGAPWFSRQELLRVKHTRQIKELEQYLYRTRGLQAEFIVERAKRALPRLVSKTPAHLKAKVAKNINDLANTPGGWYALIDYVNFKGEGLSRTGGYNGQNWGILQVLENMRPTQPGSSALNAFADSAYQTLARRVRNSPPSRGEARWLPGWRNRTNTYRTL